MCRVDELNKEISMEIQITEGKDARNSIKDYHISKMALAIQKAITTRTELQASVESMVASADDIWDINTIHADHVRERSDDIFHDSNDFLSTVDMDIKLALIDLGKHYHVSDSKYMNILADIEAMEHYKTAADIVDSMALALDRPKYRTDKLHELGTKSYDFTSSYPVEKLNTEGIHPLPQEVWEHMEDEELTEEERKECERLLVELEIEKEMRNE